MSHQNLRTPLGVIAAGLVIIVLLMVGPFPSSNATLNLPQENYPAQTATAKARAYPNDPVQDPASPTPTETTDPIAAPTATLDPETTPTATPELSPTETLEPTLEPTQVLEETPADLVSTAVPSDTSTPTPTPPSELVCAPNRPVTITGRGVPYTGFLLYFNNRPVSGGSVEADGSFAIDLLVVGEDPGTYPVVVRERGTSEVLKSTSCRVPAQPKPTYVRGR